MIIETSRFGKVPYIKSEIITMIRSILGFDGHRKFIFISPKEQEPFKWLQSLEDPDLSFLVVDPLCFKPDYMVQIDPEDLVALKADRKDDIAVFVLVSIPRHRPELMSANLLAPLIINKSSLSGAQLVLSESGYSAENPIFGELAGKMSVAALNDDERE